MGGGRLVGIGGGGVASRLYMYKINAKLDAPFQYIHQYTCTVFGLTHFPEPIRTCMLQYH